MRLLGFLELSILILYIAENYNKHGYLYFVDISKVAFIMWLFAYGLYNIHISTLLKPSIEINIIGLVIIFNFWIMSNYKLKIRDSIQLVANELENENYNKKCTTGFGFLFILGVIAFCVTYLKFGFTIFQNNKINRTELAFGYFYNALVVCAVYYLYMIAKKNKNNEKVKYGILEIITLLMLVCLLNRGNFIMIFMGALVIFIFMFYSKTKKKYLAKKTLIFIGTGIILITMAFGIIGNVRFETVSREVYHISYVELYGFDKNFPSGLGQIYIYITSPLENMSDVIKNQNINEYTWFANLFYPVIKVVADLIGKGEMFVNWINASYDIFPVLKSSTGLNVMSFMADAYQDGGYIGIIIYLILYDTIIIFSSKVLRSKLYGLSKVLIYGLLLQLIIWSVFSDSVLKMASVWVNIVLIYIIDFVAHRIRIKN